MSSRKLYSIIKTGIISLLEALTWRVRNSDLALFAVCALIALFMILGTLAFILIVPKDTEEWIAWCRLLLSLASKFEASVSSIDWVRVFTSKSTIFTTVVMLGGWTMRRMTRVDKRPHLSGRTEVLQTANENLEKNLIRAIQSFGNVAVRQNQGFTSFQFGRRILVRVRPASESPLPHFYVYVDTVIKLSNFPKQERALIVASDNKKWSQYRVEVTGERGIEIVKRLIASVKL